MLNLRRQSGIRLRRPRNWNQVHSDRSRYVSVPHDNDSSDRIMLLGRWLSKAFLAYIRPQVLEWTNNMSLDMTQADSFLDVGTFDQAGSHTPRIRPDRFHGPDAALVIPRMHLHH
jgi:hypothetical protein